jgi:surface protein
MKSIQQHINERLQLTKDRVKQYEYFPETREELKDIIEKITRKHENDKIIDLNMIDTSKITDMSELFTDNKHNYNISEWNVSNVTNMDGMFYNSNFNNDISQWDVSNVTTMFGMFNYSQFNQDISNWNVSNVIYMKYMFNHCPLEKNPPFWYHD